MQERFSYVENFGKQMRETAEKYEGKGLPWLTPDEYPLVSAVLKESEKIPGVSSAKVIALKPLSNHPDDYYLRVVIVETDNHYVVWEENTQDTARCGHPAYFTGHYFNKTAVGLGEAIVKFNEKGRAILIMGDEFVRKYATTKTIKDYTTDELIEALEERGLTVLESDTIDNEGSMPSRDDDC